MRSNMYIEYEDCAILEQQGGFWEDCVILAQQGGFGSTGFRNIVLGQQPFRWQFLSFCFDQYLIQCYCCQYFYVIVMSIISVLCAITKGLLLLAQLKLSHYAHQDFMFKIGFLELSYQRYMGHYGCYCDLGYQGYQTRPLSINMLAGYEQRAIFAYTVAFCVNYGYLRGGHSSDGICIRACVSERQKWHLCVIVIFFLEV